MTPRRCLGLLAAALLCAAQLTPHADVLHDGPAEALTIVEAGCLDDSAPHTEPGAESHRQLCAGCLAGHRRIGVAEVSTVVIVPPRPSATPPGTDASATPSPRVSAASPRAPPTA